MRSLVLNASWEPLAVVSTRRAFTLVLRDKAELVELADQPLRSASGAWPAPSVVRLVRYVRVPRRPVAVTRRGVIERDGGRCGYCGCTGKLTIDHVIPRSRPGGTHTWSNVVAACEACNNSKGCRLPEEVNMRLRVPLTTPQGRGIYRAEPAWAQYLGA